MLILAKATMALMLGFVLSLITGLFVIPAFKKLHFGQTTKNATIFSCHYAIKKQICSCQN